MEHINLDYEPAAQLAELQAKVTEQPPATLPNCLPLSAIKIMPELFQPRGMDERHIQELRRAIAIHGHLEPILVFQAGPDAVLMDGHHRVAAYGQAKVKEPVPVRYFDGPLEFAVLEAGRANSRAKLPMTTRERQDYAWRLVLLVRYSKRQISEAAGISAPQVAIMRRALKALGADAADYRSWWQAQKKAKGLKADMTQAEVDEMLEAQAARFADRMTREFGSKLSNNVGLAARALNIHFGRRLPELLQALRDYLPEDTGEDETEDF